MPPNPNFLLSVDPQQPPEALAGAVVAIGNFDGVHRGHRAVIARAQDLVAKGSGPLLNLENAKSALASAKAALAGDDLPLRFSSTGI